MRVRVMGEARLEAPHRPGGSSCGRSPSPDWRLLSPLPSPCRKSAAPAPAPDPALSSPAEENEERTMIDPTSKDDPKFKELVKVRREGANLWVE